MFAVLIRVFFVEFLNFYISEDSLPDQQKGKEEEKVITKVCLHTLYPELFSIAPSRSRRAAVAAVTTFRFLEYFVSNQLLLFNDLQLQNQKTLKASDCFSIMSTKF